ncbi:MAG: Slp family lipoprotein [Nitrospirota bacterium]
MVRHRMLIGAALAAITALTAGCSPPFPRDLMEKVDRRVAFAEVQKDPKAHAGKLIMLGGMIVEIKNLRQGTRIEVLQKPLDGQGRPELTDATGGRFLVLTTQFLDGAVYHRGRTITVVGEVAPPQVLPLGETEYRYPVLSARSLHLWAPYTGPSFSIGIGVFHGY